MPLGVFRIHSAENEMQPDTIAIPPAVGRLPAASPHPPACRARRREVR